MIRTNNNRNQRQPKSDNDNRKQSQQSHHQPKANLTSPSRSEHSNQRREYCGYQNHGSTEPPKANISNGTTTTQSGSSRSTKSSISTHPRQNAKVPKMYQEIRLQPEREKEKTNEEDLAYEKNKKGGYAIDLDYDDSSSEDDDEHEYDDNFLNENEALSPHTFAGL